MTDDAAVGRPGALPRPKRAPAAVTGQLRPQRDTLPGRQTDQSDKQTAATVLPQGAQRRGAI
jgi:hypothetical protein